MRDGDRTAAFSTDLTDLVRLALAVSAPMVPGTICLTALDVFRLLRTTGFTDITESLDLSDWIDFNDWADLSAPSDLKGFSGLWALRGMADVSNRDLIWDCPGA